MTMTEQRPRTPAAPGRREVRSRPLRPIVWDTRERATLAAILVVTFFLTAWNLGGGPRYFEDEGTYTARAWSLFEFSLEPYWYMFDHVPLAWMQMAPIVALSEFLGIGESAVRTARVASLVALIACVLLMYLIARRMMINRVITAVALLAFVASPLTQEFMRRVYLDNIATAWALLAFAVAVGPARHRWNYGLAGMAMGLAVLSKMTMLVLTPALALAVLTYARRSQRWTSPMATALCTTGVVALFPLWALSIGRFDAFWSGTIRQLSRDGGGSMWVEGTPRAAMVARWYDYDQTFLFVGLAAAVLVLVFSARFRWIGVAALLPMVQILREGGYLPAMYIIFMLPFLTLAMAACLQGTWNWVATNVPAPPERTRRALTAVAVAGALVLVGPVVFDRLTADLYTQDVNAPVDEGVAWILENTTADERVLVDDVTFSDLRRNGRTDVWDQVVNVYKADLDPLAADRLPGGWREFDYVLDTPVMRGSLADPGLDEARQAHRSSTVITSFGEEPFQVDVRMVLK